MYVLTEEKGGKRQTLKKPRDCRDAVISKIPPLSSGSPLRYNLLSADSADGRDSRVLRRSDNHFLLGFVLFSVHVNWSLRSFSSFLFGTTALKKTCSFESTSAVGADEKEHGHERLPGSCQRVMFSQLSAE